MVIIDFTKYMVIIDFTKYVVTIGQKLDDWNYLVRLADSNVKLQDVSGSSINSASWDLRDLKDVNKSAL